MQLFLTFLSLAVCQHMQAGTIYYSLVQEKVVPCQGYYQTTENMRTAVEVFRSDDVGLTIRKKREDMVVYRLNRGLKRVKRQVVPFWEYRLGSLPAILILGLEDPNNRQFTRSKIKAAVKSANAKDGLYKAAVAIKGNIEESFNQQFSDGKDASLSGRFDLLIKNEMNLHLYRKNKFTGTRCCLYFGNSMFNMMGDYWKVFLAKEGHQAIFVFMDGQPQWINFTQRIRVVPRAPFMIIMGKPLKKSLQTDATKIHEAIYELRDQYKKNPESPKGNHLKVDELIKALKGHFNKFKFGIIRNRDDPKFTSLIWRSETPQIITLPPKDPPPALPESYLPQLPSTLPALPNPTTTTPTPTSAPVMPPSPVIAPAPPSSSPPNYPPPPPPPTKPVTPSGDSEPTSVEVKGKNVPKPLPKTIFNGKQATSAPATGSSSTPQPSVTQPVNPLVASANSEPAIIQEKWTRANTPLAKTPNNIDAASTINKDQSEVQSVGLPLPPPPTSSPPSQALIAQHRLSTTALTSTSKPLGDREVVKPTLPAQIVLNQRNDAQPPNPASGAAIIPIPTRPLPIPQGFQGDWPQTKAEVLAKGEAPPNTQPETAPKTPISARDLARSLNPPPSASQPHDGAGRKPEAAPASIQTSVNRPLPDLLIKQKKPLPQPKPKPRLLPSSLGATDGNGEVSKEEVTPEKK